MAAGGNGTGSTQMISGINVTPLVDIMLVLLIIFMVTAKLVIAPATALPLELPKATMGEATQVIFSIGLLPDGSTRVNGQPVASDDAILPSVRAEHAAHPELNVVIQADGHVYHERVIHVMDLLSQAGITHIAFGVVVPTGTSPAPP
ncbi:MAG: ExbD/TolR family protein [Myxococcaceae bacterium]